MSPKYFFVSFEPAQRQIKDIGIRENASVEIIKKKKEVGKPREKPETSYHVKNTHVR